MGTYTNRKICMTLWSDCTCCSANDTAIELVNIENFSSLGDFCFDFSFWPELKGKLNIFFCSPWSKNSRNYYFKFSNSSFSSISSHKIKAFVWNSFNLIRNLLSPNEAHGISSKHWFFPLFSYRSQYIPVEKIFNFTAYFL